MSYRYSIGCGSNCGSHVWTRIFPNARHPEGCHGYCDSEQEQGRIKAVKYTGNSVIERKTGKDEERVPTCVATCDVYCRLLGLTNNFQLFRFSLTYQMASSILVRHIPTANGICPSFDLGNDGFGSGVKGRVGTQNGTSRVCVQVILISPYVVLFLRISMWAPYSLHRDVLSKFTNSDANGLA